jgi:porphobilinogen synthase
VKIQYYGLVISWIDHIMITKFPYTRLRRPRMTAFSQRLLQENWLTPQDFVYPVFILPGTGKREPIQAMPGIERLSLDQLIIDAKIWHGLGIQALNLYPVVEPHLKSSDCRESYNSEALLQSSVRALKEVIPTLGLITDVALDPFTPHGHDGVINAQGAILNDETLEILSKQALSHAEAGADIVAPSDMMDGRIGHIRETLESSGFKNTLILSYTAKYASQFYEPFRHAVGSSHGLGGKNKSSYQMNPGNLQEALLEAEQDIAEGADMIMVKPAMGYLDVLYALTQRFSTPVFAFQVSGEYTMQQLAIEAGWLSTDIILESLLCIKRAGARAIHTYFAIEAAKMLSSET